MSNNKYYEKPHKNKKPTRCIDPVIKYCQGCKYGKILNRFDDYGFVITKCTLGYDRGRPEDEPTEKELKDFDDFCTKLANEDLSDK